VRKACQARGRHWDSACYFDLGFVRQSQGPATSTQFSLIRKTSPSTLHRHTAGSRRYYRCAYGSGRRRGWSIVSFQTS